MGDIQTKQKGTREGMWVPIDERVPNAADADATGCVLVFHLLQGAMICGWHRVKENRFHSHWMPLPKPPNNAKALRDAMEQVLIDSYGTGYGGRKGY